MKEKERNKFYLTTAIAYASRKPHFGNTYEVIMSDAVVRYHRAKGEQTYFCTGTDEHGQKIENCAKEAGITPQQYVDGVSGQIRGVWDRMNSSYDYFIRTTDEKHVQAVQKIFKRFYDQGDIYKGYYEGWYCTPDESFYTDSQVVDGKCPDCGRPVQKAREEAYFFRMSKYVDRLLAHIDSHPEFIEPESRKKEMVNNFLRVEGGLQDLCVSRTSFSWGIPVTFDDRHVVYVWLDALTNYITALGYDPDKTYEEQSEHFRTYWPADVHVIGKDILRFHTIYWPIFLMALDLPLPKKVFGHPWFNFGMDKMSKSRGNVIYADALADVFTADGVRYYALAEMPYAADGSITYESVIKRYNTDLVNNLGNLVKRTLDMDKKYFDRVIPAPSCKEELDGELVRLCGQTCEAVVREMDSYHVADALTYIIALLTRANKYIDETTPWTLAKDEEKRERLGTVLYHLLATIRCAAVLLHPFIPDTARTILTQIGDKAALAELEATKNEHGYLLLEHYFGSDDKYYAYPAGGTVEESTVLFARIDEEKQLQKFEEERQAQMKQAQAEEQKAQPQKPEGVAQIGIEKFMDVELRTAQVLSCEKVPGAKKLLCLQLDLGYEKRQVLSGIAKFYQPADLIGRKVIVVANLKPAMLCGMESNGMILASGEEQVRVVFLADDTPLGERVR
ncbi:MAG: methionine--tRNA ligase [Clostridia bacterium]|nr:methionine--tRNA ligase [Clostridia bacterium]